MLYSIGRFVRLAEMWEHPQGVQIYGNADRLGRFNYPQAVFLLREGKMRAQDVPPEQRRTNKKTV